MNNRDKQASPRQQPDTGSGSRLSKYTPGVVLVAALAAVATLLGAVVPVVGGPVFGITIGMLIQTLRPTREVHRPGVSFSAKYVLQASVVMLGLGLSLRELFTTGVDTFPVMIGTLLVALGGAYVLGKLLNVGGELRTLIGTGTAICGGSAIAATAAVISASELSVAYAISTIFVYNALAVVIFPMLGHLLDMSQTAFGVWAGTAINDTSSVVAAGYVYGEEAGDTSVIVKLARTTMIIPVTLALALWQMRTLRRSSALGNRRLPWKKMFPWFILWFCVATTANTVGLVPSGFDETIGTSAKFLITMALTGVGLSAQFRQMRATGLRPLVFGGLLWVCVAVSSLIIQQLTGLY